MPKVIASQKIVLTSLLSSNSWQYGGSLGGPTPKSDNIPSESRGRAHRSHAEHSKPVATANPPGRGGHQIPPNSVLPHLGVGGTSRSCPFSCKPEPGSLPRSIPDSYWSSTSGPLESPYPGPSTLHHNNNHHLQLQWY